MARALKFSVGTYKIFVILQGLSPSWYLNDRPQLRRCNRLKSSQHVASITPNSARSGSNSLTCIESIACLQIRNSKVEYSPCNHCRWPILAFFNTEAFAEGKSPIEKKVQRMEPRNVFYCYISFYWINVDTDDCATKFLRSIHATIRG